METIRHRYSLIAARDTFSGRPGRFLVYWDARWACWLLPNFPTPEKDPERKLAEEAAALFHLPAEDITLVWLDRRLTEKFSESSRAVKLYDHTLYTATAPHFPAALRRDAFTLDGTTFRWMTIQEMKQDENIMKKNRDVVETLEEKAA